jgi:hypothetical protein
MCIAACETCNYGQPIAFERRYRLRAPVIGILRVTTDVFRHMYIDSTHLIHIQSQEKVPSCLSLTRTVSNLSQRTLLRAVPFSMQAMSSSPDLIGTLILIMWLLSSSRLMISHIDCEMYLYYGIHHVCIEHFVAKPAYFPSVTTKLWKLQHNLIVYEDGI